MKCRLNVKKCWHHVLYVTSVVSLQQRNVKKSEKSMKISYWTGKYSYLLKDLRNFNEIFRKDVAKDKIKSHKKARFHPLFKKYIFLEKPQGGLNLKPSPLLEFRSGDSELFWKEGILKVWAKFLRNACGGVYFQ